jgi:hypothetical protein
VTGGAEKVTYTPTPDGTYLSSTVEAYYMGQKYALTGVYGDSIEIDAVIGGVPKCTIAMKGILPVAAGIPSADVAQPSVTYPAAWLKPPKATVLAFSLNSLFAPVRIKSFKFKWERMSTPRSFDNSAGQHGGFQPALVRKAMLEILVEASALATALPWNTATTLNPYKLAELNTSETWSILMGTAQYFKHTLSGSNAQLNPDPDAMDGASAMWKLSFDIRPTTLISNDEWTWLYS